MSKHTPGPWANGPMVGISGQDDFGLSLGFVSTHSAERREECRANTRLIVKSPEMLSLIESLYTRFGDYRAEWPGRHSPQGQQLLAQMRDLIAEATGRSDQEVQDDYGTRLARAERGE